MAMNFKYLKDSLVDAAKAVAGSEAYKQAVDLTKDVAYKAGDTVHQYAVSAKDSLALAAGLRTLQNYDVERHQVATAGPGRAWKIFPASSRRLAGAQNTEGPIPLPASRSQPRPLASPIPPCALPGCSALAYPSLHSHLSLPLLPLQNSPALSQPVVAPIAPLPESDPRSIAGRQHLDP